MISVCKLLKNYNYFYKTFAQKDLINRTGGLVLHLKEPTKAFISLHQKHKKFFDDKFSYDIIRLMIAEVDTSKEQLKVVKTI